MYKKTSISGLIFCHQRAANTPPHPPILQRLAEWEPPHTHSVGFTANQTLWAWPVFPASHILKAYNEIEFGEVKKTNKYWLVPFLQSNH
jgi:hypothetical protein